MRRPPTAQPLRLRSPVPPRIEAPACDSLTPSPRRRLGSAAAVKCSTSGPHVCPKEASDAQLCPARRRRAFVLGQDPGPACDDAASPWDASHVNEGAADGGWDFFVSYTRADQAWAEWIAWTLEEAGYSLLIQAWDFVPGAHWISSVERGVQQAKRTIVVLSEGYEESMAASAEWWHVWSADPPDSLKQILPVRVESFTPRSFPLPFGAVDLFNVDRLEARAKLLTAVKLGLPAQGALLSESEGRVRAVPVPLPFPGEQLVDAEHFDTLVSRNNLASVYRDLGRLDEAVALYQRTLA
ncbi:TIR domain-containing protein, partial [Parafrankia elaeagni]|uniref:TIR domain-containing protein n=1 Tax=Parafrankia elaeagni TaxID=222534 RepID=UPI0012B541B6